MTRNELLAFDDVLARYLQKDSLLPRLKEVISNDYSMLHASNDAVRHAKDSKLSNDIHMMKHENTQVDYNKKIKNPDAQFKWLAFSAMAERRNKKLSDTDTDVNEMWNDNNFEEYYKRQLLVDQQRPPRKINPKDFEKRKPWDKPVGLPF